MEENLKLAFVDNGDGTTNVSFYVKDKLYNKGEVIEAFGDQYEVLFSDTVSLWVKKIV